MKIVNVIPLKRGPLLDDLTYFTTKQTEVGSIVTISIRNKKTLGLVVSSEDVSDRKMNIKGFKFNLKKIIDVKEKSIFLKDYLDSAILMSTYFASNKSSAIASLIPALFREEYDKIALGLKKIAYKNESIENKTSLKNEKLLLQEPLENRISIYKTLIRENFALKKSVFITLPTENDVESFEEYLSKGIEQFTYTFHGGISSKKIVDKFKTIMSTDHPVLILGTPPYLSIPRVDIGVIVLEHESSNGYKMISKPHFDLRIFVELFASKINAKFIMSDNLLRFDTIGRRDIDGLVPMHPLSFRIDFNREIEIENPRPILETTNLNKNKLKPFKIFSENTVEEIRKSIARNNKVFVFSMRKGLATQTLCADCGEIVSCDKCKAPLVLYASKANQERFFVCNRCGEERSGDMVCGHCQSWNLKPLGIGTDTVFAELSELFPKTKILKLDRESVKNKKELDKVMAEVSTDSPFILVGTEMALLYLKEKVSLSVIASFDSFWSIPNFKMSERVIQLAVSIAAITDKKFIIQTKNEKDLAVLAVQSRNLLPFIRAELEDRKNMGYPPYKRFIKIKHTGNKVETLKAKHILEETFSEYKPLIFSGFVAQVKSSYITNALIKMDPQNWSLPILSHNAEIERNLLAKLLALPPSFEIFIDPEDLL